MQMIRKAVGILNFWPGRSTESPLSEAAQAWISLTHNYKSTATVKQDNSVSVAWVLWFWSFFFCPLLYFVRLLEYSEWNILGKWQLLLLKCLRIQTCGIWSWSFFCITTVTLREALCSSRCSIFCSEILTSLCLEFFLEIQNPKRVHNKVIRELACGGRRRTVTRYDDGWKRNSNPNLVL